MPCRSRSIKLPGVEFLHEQKEPRFRARFTHPAISARVCVRAREISSVIVTKYSYNYTRDKIYRRDFR